MLPKSVKWLHGWTKRNESSHMQILEPGGSRQPVRGKTVTRSGNALHLVASHEIEMAAKARNYSDISFVAKKAKYEKPISG